MLASDALVVWAGDLSNEDSSGEVVSAADFVGVASARFFAPLSRPSRRLSPEPSLDGGESLLAPEDEALVAVPAGETLRTVAVVADEGTAVLPSDVGPFRSLARRRR